MDDIKYVVKNSDHVKINQSIIDSFINTIETKQYRHWSQQDDFFKQLSEKEIILFSFILESINFCFWPNYDWKISYNNKEYFGSDTLLFILLESVKNGVIKLDINELNKISKDEFYTFMKSNNTYPILMEERYNSFKNTINVIYNKSNFFDELFNIKSDIELEKYIVSNFNSFNDVSEYKGRTIHFDKRCRLVIGDLFYISNTIKNNINSINNIKGCADYSIPRFFREIKILEYSKELSDMIDNGIEIKHNSNYEIEIRAATLDVLEYIKNVLKEKGVIISSIELDNIIWCASRVNKILNPHHTISIYY